MKPAHVMVLAMLTVVTVAAGAEAVVFALAGRWVALWWAVGMLVVGLVGGALFWL